MRKLFALFGVLMIIALLVLAGCDKSSEKKVVSSRPVQAQQVGGEAPVATAPSAPEPSAPSEEPSAPVDEAKSVVPAGAADCEQLNSVEIGELMGGTWSKTTDCPQRPMMPKGVSVCRCDYDGPKQVYVNVETQLYSENSEALKVYDMYCKGADAAVVGEKGCSMLKTSDTRPNYVYFLKGNYFVKVSCLGGACPIASVTELAKKVDEKI
jgi:hypothetical protein